MLKVQSSNLGKAIGGFKKRHPTLKWCCAILKTLKNKKLCVLS